MDLLQLPLVRPFVEAPLPDPQNQALTLPDALGLLILVWSLDITAFVLTRALERPYLLCIGLVVGYFFLIYSLQATLLRPII